MVVIKLGREKFGDMQAFNRQMTDIEKERAKQIKTTIVLLTAFAVFCCIYYFKHSINPQDTTIFAFSYKYGFISRGLLGTLWMVLDKILPFSIMNYRAIYIFTECMTVLFFALILYFYYVCMRQVSTEDVVHASYLTLFLSIFSFPMFLTYENFGRLDEYLVMITLMCCILIVKEKMEWLVVPLCVLGVIMHQGFVFMNVNIVLVLLFYKMLQSPEKKRKKYGILFGTTFVLVSAFFLYFELFSHFQGKEIYSEIVSLAKSLSMDGESYSESLVNHEILGVDVYEEEYIFHLMNRMEMPLFVIAFLPYIVYGGGFLLRLIHAKQGKDLLTYLAVVLGGITVIPEMILKVDYGRYMYALIFYYIGITLCLLAMGDGEIRQNVNILFAKLKKQMPASKIVMLLYPMTFMPFLDVHITQRIGDVVQQIWNR